MKELGKKSWLAIVLFSLCGQVAWTIENMLFNVFIQNEFNATLNDIALMVSASAISATLTTLFMGAYSDKIGKRKIFICGGYILWGLSIMAFALLKVENLSKIFGQTINAFALGVGLTIGFDCLMTFFGSTANDAAFNAWMTDTTDTTNRGKVEGVNSAMPLIAILVVFGGKMLVEGSPHEWTIIFLTIGIIILLVGILGIFIIKEPQLEVKNEPYFKNIFYGFRPSIIKKNSLLYIFLLGMCIFSISIQVFMPYLILYFTNTLQLENYVLIFAPAIILAAAFTVFYGKLIDKYGFIKTSIISLSIYLVGLILLGLLTNIVFVFIGTLFMMMGYLSLGACFNASIRDYTPEDKVGLFQGIRIFVSVLIPMLVGPWIGSILSGNTSEGFLGVAGDAYTPSSLIFIAGCVIGLLTFGVIYLVSLKKKGESNA
jgi:MFS family permease